MDHLLQLRSLTCWNVSLYRRVKQMGRPTKHKHTHSERETAYTLGSLASILGPFFLLLTWHVKDLAAADPAGGRVKKWAPSYCLTETRRLIEWILRRAENGDFQKRRGRNEHKKEEGEVKSCHTCLLDFTSKMWKKSSSGEEECVKFCCDILILSYFVFYLMWQSKDLTDCCEIINIMVAIRMYQFIVTLGVACCP